VPKVPMAKSPMTKIVSLLARRPRTRRHTSRILKQRLVESLRKSTSFKDGLYEGLLSSQIIPHFSAVFQGSNGLPRLGASNFPQSAKPFSVRYRPRHRIFP
jgi:hypothetical protein